MASFVTQGVRPLKGTIRLEGDKSIAHRAVMLAGLANGTTSIRNFPIHKDAAATLRVFSDLGVRIKKSKDSISIRGTGLYGLKAPECPLSAGESGTTLRLLLGILAGQKFKASVEADRSLSRRPMLRVTAPLRQMGCLIKASKAGGEEHAPMTITGGSLHPITYRMPVASAQVKSSLLLAGLYADGITRVIEPLPTRDHTERMLALFGAKIRQSGRNISIRGCLPLRSPGTIVIPGDISSASFFIVAASLIRGSLLTIRGVSLNPTRTGVLRVLSKMGARIKVSHRSKGRGEPYGDITIRSCQLKAVTISRDEVPYLIDELPVLMVAACFATGTTGLRGVEELRVKETDRPRSMTENLSKMGARIEIRRFKKREDIVICGTGSLHGAEVNSYDDHRTAMSMIVAGLAAQGRTSIDDISCISKSFPDFLKVLRSVIVK
jgi:3-phosphoshikimate 1-carboxyvinyltransferase